MNKPKVAAIVPALDEEAHIGNVLAVLLKSKYLDEVIVVDDGSIDKTAEISRKMGARVVSLPQKGGSGKANAMREGVKSTDADIVIFFDADLVGLSENHISLLEKPILEDKAVMSVGVRGRWLGLPKLIIKIDSLLAIGGERAMKRFVFESLPEEFLRGFAVETGLNFYCYKKKLPVVYVDLKGLDMIAKEIKWGLWKGFKRRLKMIWQIVRVRYFILTSKVKF